MNQNNHGLITNDDGHTRCWWPGEDPEYIRYHDEEWGRPVDDDQRLFEKLCLEGFQAGLSWITILRKRENFRTAFAHFDPTIVARYTDEDVERLLQDAGIIRHRGKIEATINNAQRALALQQEAGSLASFVWGYEPKAADRPRILDYQAAMSLTKTPESTALSKDLKKRGWRFVGPTTCYAFMQSMGLVNDHLEGCFIREACEADRAAFTRPTS
ncbi:MAG: DNA-3-methyladenine glycosylase I [Pseudomonadota bacterium]